MIWSIDFPGEVSGIVAVAGGIAAAVRLARLATMEGHAAIVAPFGRYWWQGGARTDGGNPVNDNLPGAAPGRPGTVFIFEVGDAVAVYGGKPTDWAVVIVMADDETTGHRVEQLATHAEASAIGKAIAARGGWSFRDSRSDPPGGDAA